MKRSESLEAVTVCVRCDDFLVETIKWNTPHFDRWIIVTEPSDERTRELCRKYNLECLITEDGTRHGSGFNKGRLIQRGLQQVTGDGWRVHIDADIALPHGFRHLVQSGDLHKDFIYGADRIDVRGWDKWQKILDSEFLENSLDYGNRVVIPDGFQVGVRWSHPIFGYVPIGYFQLWHSGEDEWHGIKHRSYPLAHNTAARTDVQWGLKWDRHKRAIIPELIVAHLMSTDSKLGANWGGRKTLRFGPEWLKSRPNTYPCHPHHPHHPPRRRHPRD